MIYKSSNAPTFVKDFDESRREAVIAFATYNSLDSDQDIATKGMFNKSINEHFDKIRFFKNHDKNIALGLIKEFMEDDMHAYVRVQFSKATAGNDAWIMAQEGVMKDASYGFTPIKQEKIEGKGRRFKEVKLYEVSLLTHWGAHPMSGLRSIEKGVSNEELKDLESHVHLLEKFIRNTKASDETIKQAIDQLEIIKTFLNINTVSTQNEPPTSDTKSEDTLKELLNIFKTK